MTQGTKSDIKKKLVDCLSPLEEVQRIVVFGSFLSSAEPNDIDVAVFQDSDQGYLPLAMKYRRAAKPVIPDIAIDIFPLRKDASGSFLDEISKGEVIYER